MTDVSGCGVTRAEDLLLSPTHVAAALGAGSSVEVVEGVEPPAGNILATAASDSVYRKFRGTFQGDAGAIPFTASSLILLFDSGGVARHMFERVAQAAHLSIEVEGASVAVETVSAGKGLVSYWGFICRGKVLVVLALDTPDPQVLSIADLRSLVVAQARRLAEIVGDSPNGAG